MNDQVPVLALKRFIFVFAQLLAKEITKDEFNRKVKELNKEFDLV